MEYVTEWRDSLDTIENVWLRCNLCSLSERLCLQLEAARRHVSIKLSVIARQHRCFVGGLWGVTGQECVLCVSYCKGYQLPSTE